MLFARGPTRWATRSRISAAALLVNVMARIWPGVTPRSPSRYAIRRVSTAVLPEPAPATMSSGEPVWVTASRCCGLRPSSRASEVVARTPGFGAGTGRPEATGVFIVVPNYRRSPTAVPPGRDRFDRYALLGRFGDGWQTERHVMCSTSPLPATLPSVREPMTEA